ncbi:MAG: FGGY family carbohydrate kinase [Rubritalea sp.]|uniref:xylulokinase n=1 Tax=Rubritalea sp. TaxID=2109375 RepID=UPI0032420626
MHLGLDCSTQSLSAIIIDVKSGETVYETSINFEVDLPHYQTSHGFVRGTEPDEFFSNPIMWVEALDLLFTRMQQEAAPLNSIVTICGSAQQHATVYLNEHFERTLENLSPNIPLAEQLSDVFTRPVSPIWLDSSTHQDCAEITNTIGSVRKVTKRTGSAAIERFSAAQIRKYAKQFPERWHETNTVHLASSFLCSLLIGKSAAIDFGDGAGMNLMHINKRKWDKKMAQATADGTLERLPKLRNTTRIAGTIAPYFSSKFGINPTTRSTLWTGDNPASLIGMGVIRKGTWVISLGTSYTLFSAVESPFPDPQGYGHIFGNPVGHYMSLSCFKNGALACVDLKKQLGISWDEFNTELLKKRSLESPVSLPFFDTEITPPASAVDQSQATPASLIDGQFLNMRQHSLWHGEFPETILVTGGISQSNGVCQTIANIFQRPVQRLASHGSASLGAALIAASADGYDIDTLIEQFCTPIEGTTIEPNPGTEIVYQALGEKFTEQLYQHIRK